MADFIARSQLDIPDLLDERDQLKKHAKARELIMSKLCVIVDDLKAEVAELKDRNERLTYDILNAQGMG